MSRQRYSGFAQFPDFEKRDQFVRAVLGSNAGLAGRAHIAGSRPTIVFENLTAGQHKKIVSTLEGLGRWFEDAQFKTMG